MTVAFATESMDVRVRPDGRGGTVLEVRQLTFFCVLYVIPVLLSDEEVEEALAADVLAGTDYFPQK